jgi:hypothetical protein
MPFSYGIEIAKLLRFSPEFIFEAEKFRKNFEASNLDDPALTEDLRIDYAALLTNVN